MWLTWDLMVDGLTNSFSAISACSTFDQQEQHGPLAAWNIVHIHWDMIRALKRCFCLSYSGGEI
jgi:hypothetical protein